MNNLTNIDSNSENIVIYNIFIGPNYYISQCKTTVILKLSPQETYNSVFTFTATLLVSLLQLKYQGDHASSPFDVNPATMFFAVISFLLYSLTYVVCLKSSPSLSSSSMTRMNNNVIQGLYQKWMVLFGSMALASLSSLLFSCTQRYVVYVLYAIFGMGIVIMHWRCVILGVIQMGTFLRRKVNILPLHMREGM